ncbi:hypothetical protein [Sneathiella chinensis]|uniref:Uncharacterized protein n=1 Tax=Sneathiella chinensis TaxID=349750 RepID=A0ABQ5U941_9PROT|nr:hypothetical protein [Sneathiella chinensis]GLQ07016.1 hypothetical protein GCM10007924_22370 [Sneathiella chinensis]
MSGPKSGPCACDAVIRYEHLAEDLQEIDQLPGEFLEIFQSLNSKGTYRDPASQDAKRFFIENGLEDQITPLLSEVR